MEYEYKSFKLGFSVRNNVSPIVDMLSVSVSSNEPTVEIMRGSDKFMVSLSDVIVAFIDKVYELQVDRKSNYVFIECEGSSEFHNLKSTLSCKISKKTNRELEMDRERKRVAENQKKHEEAMRIANEKRRIARESKKLKDGSID